MSKDTQDFFNPEQELEIKDSAILPEVKIASGEEDEVVIFKIRGRLYRWRNDEWKERATGECKLLRHKENKKIRFIIRQDKSLKGMANFMIAEDPLCILKPHQGSDKMFFFTAYDFSEDEAVLEKFVFKLGNAENAAKFKKAFEDAKLFNQLIKAGKESEAVFAPEVEDEPKENKVEDKSEEVKSEEVKTEEPKTEEVKAEEPKTEEN